jgi:hypothetical protein
LAQDVKMSQQQSQAVVEVCLAKYRKGRRPCKGPPGKLGRLPLNCCFREVLLELIRLAPHHFVGLDSLEGIELVHY